MAVGSLFENPATPEQMAAWAFAHMAHHRDLNRRIMEVYEVRIDEYVLDPIDPENMNAWFYQHQDMHDQQNAVLSIAGYALNPVHWDKDTEAKAAWIWANANEHFRAGTILGV